MVYQLAQPGKLNSGDNRLSVWFKSYDGFSFSFLLFSFTVFHLLFLQQFLPTELVLDGDDEILVLAFDEALSVGDGVLGIEFSGALNEYLRGLYRWYFLFKFAVSISLNRNHFFFWGNFKVLSSW